MTEVSEPLTQMQQLRLLLQHASNNNQSNDIPSGLQALHEKATAQVEGSSLLIKNLAAKLAQQVLSTTGGDGIIQNGSLDNKQKCPQGTHQDVGSTPPHATSSQSTGMNGFPPGGAMSQLGLMGIVVQHAQRLDAKLSCIEAELHRMGSLLPAAERLQVIESKLDRILCILEAKATS